MRITRLLLGVAVVGLVAAAAPSVNAQCGTPETFGTQIGLGGLTPIQLPAGVSNAQVLGRMWDSNNSAQCNNFAAYQTTCGFGGYSLPSPPAPPGFTVVNGGIGATTCTYPGTNCIGPAGPCGGELILLMEAEHSGGADASFGLLRKDKNAGDPVNFDMTQLAPPITSTNQDTLVTQFQPFPRPRVTSSSRSGVVVTVSWRLPNTEANFAGLSGGGALGGGSSIKGFDLYRAVGSDPTTRDIAAGGWSLVQSAPYNPADGALPSFPVNCDQGGNEFYALGMSFGDAADPGSVQSLMVGASTAVECNPNLAEPDVKPSKPIQQRSKPSKSR